METRMAAPISADYGFVKTTSGQETTFVVRESPKNRIRKIAFHGVYLVVAWLTYEYSGSLLYAVAMFLALRYGFKLLGTVLNAQTKVPTITVGSTTISLGRHTYNLKDARDWNINNSVTGEIASATSVGLAVTQQLREQFGYKVSFNYGARTVDVAWELSDAQARALINEILATVNASAPS
jgi:hypothetical protein